MSIRVDNVSLIPGALVCGDRGLGVLGSDIPANGQHGPGFAFNDLLPTDASSEIRAVITSYPSAGSLFVFEDTSFEFSGPNGNYQFSYDLYRDGALYGSSTVDISLGITTAPMSTTVGATATVSAQLSSSQSLLMAGQVVATATAIVSQLSIKQPINGSALSASSLSASLTASQALTGYASGSSLSTAYLTANSVGEVALLANSYSVSTVSAELTVINVNSGLSADIKSSSSARARITLAGNGLGLPDFDTDDGVILNSTPALEIQHSGSTGGIVTIKMTVARGTDTTHFLNLSISQQAFNDYTSIVGAYLLSTRNGNKLCDSTVYPACWEFQTDKIVTKFGKGNLTRGVYNCLLVIVDQAHPDGQLFSTALEITVV